MTLTVIVTKEGRIAGVTAGARSAEGRLGYPSAWLVAGPEQRLVELDMPDNEIPQLEADQAVLKRFFADLAVRVQRDRSRREHKD